MAFVDASPTEMKMTMKRYGQDFTVLGFDQHWGLVLGVGVKHQPVDQGHSRGGGWS